MELNSVLAAFVFSAVLNSYWFLEVQNALTVAEASKGCA